VCHVEKPAIIPWAEWLSAVCAPASSSRGGKYVLSEGSVIKIVNRRKKIGKIQIFSILQGGGGLGGQRRRSMGRGNASLPSKVKGRG